MGLLSCELHFVDHAAAPAVVGPKQYSVRVPTAQKNDETPWWKEFSNHELNGFVEIALSQNLTVSQAASRVREAQAERRKLAAAPLPQVDLDSGVETRNPGRDGGGRNETSWQAGGGLILAWEIDLWQRLDSATKAAGFDSRSRAADYDTVQLLTSGEIARAYYDAVEQKILLNLLEEQLKTNRTLLELTELRFDQAGASAVDVFQQRRQLEATREQRYGARGLLRVAENRLDVLQGKAPNGFDAVTRLYFPDLATTPATGVPANLLVGRPDLRALQFQLIAEDYRIAEAIADRLPRVGIGATLNYVESAITGELIRTAVADAVLPLIDWGERKAEVGRRRAIFDEQLGRFSEAYLIAIEEVENLLFVGRREEERISSLKQQRYLSAQTLEEARNRYSNGLTDYLPVLDAVQTLQRTERELISQQRALVENRISLHLALGGPLKKK
ncbi:MAG: TolC family protein [Verrucomicrobiota bacterium]